MELFSPWAETPEPDNESDSGRWKLLWLSPIFKGEVSPFSQGSGLSGAAKPALRIALAVMLKPCSQFTCFQISLQALKFSPGLF